MLMFLVMITDINYYYICILNDSHLKIISKVYYQIIKTFHGKLKPNRLQWKTKFKSKIY